ncbi:MAG: hypothetical protein WBL20_17015 [Sphingobium sp.]|uniref:DUF7716 domain-containing protein n=1 Tax=Sphingobium sp. TaxID=1912891 RepID=UPI002E2076E6
MLVTKPLIALMMSAEEKVLPDGWIFLPAGEVVASSECLFIPDDSCPDDDDIDDLAARMGFERGLDTTTVEDICIGVKHINLTPSEDLYVRAFLYYEKFDAFLPSADAPDPPPLDEWRLGLDRKFYDQLGDEIPGSRCRREGCERDAVAMSAFCKKHHFESVNRRPCPFE